LRTFTLQRGPAEKPLALLYRPMLGSVTAEGKNNKTAARAACKK
jgi:hypothetical protein